MKGGKILVWYNCQAETNCYKVCVSILLSNNYVSVGSQSAGRSRECTNTSFHGYTFSFTVDEDGSFHNSAHSYLECLAYIRTPAGWTLLDESGA